jgi:peptide chain release factor 1
MQTVIEIRSAEGGDDSKSLVRLQYRIYEALARKQGLWLDVLDVTAGTIIFRANGQRAKEIFQNESGGHRFQRIPPNERNGRVHTSTITVSVLQAPEESEFKLNPRDVQITATCGSGKGGQKKNKTSSCIIVKHLPTGKSVRIETERSQSQNRILALGILEARLQSEKDTSISYKINAERRSQIGTGERGSYRRVCRIQHNIVEDCATGQRWTWDQYESGNWKF